MNMYRVPASCPAWLAAAAKEIGFHETGDNHGLGKYIALAHCGADGEPWCAIFANAMLEETGFPGTRSPSSQSFRHDNKFVKLPGPALGAIVVFWRQSPQSGLGHVGFYVGESPTYVYVLGGNEQDSVEIEPLLKVGPRFGLVGYYWPVTVALPTIGALQWNGHYSGTLNNKVT